MRDYLGLLAALAVWCAVIWLRTLTRDLYPWMAMWVLWVLASGVTAACVGAVAAHIHSSRKGRR